MSFEKIGKVKKTLYRMCLVTSHFYSLKSKNNYLISRFVVLLKCAFLYFVEKKYPVIFTIIVQGTIERLISKANICNTIKFCNWDITIILRPFILRSFIHRVWIKQQRLSGNPSLSKTFLAAKIFYLLVK